MDNFPYARFFLRSPTEMFKELEIYQPVVIRGVPYRLANYYPHYHLFPDLRFRQEYLYLSSSVNEAEDLYFRINGLTDHFTEEVRIRSRKSYGLSPWEYWNRVKSRYIMSRERLPLIREIIFRRVPEPTLFRLTWIKGIFSVLKFEPNIRILDFSAGWGDRLLGSIAMGFRYLGFDPNRNLQPGLERIIETFGFTDRTRYQIIYEPFETSTIDLGSNDVIFTSPPFFNLEIYDEDPTQSINRYPDYSGWFRFFIIRSLHRAWSSLKIGGYLILHLGDTKRCLLCEPINLFIESELPGSRLDGVIGIGGGSDRISPVWIWHRESTDWENRRNFAQIYPKLSGSPDPNSKN